MPGTVSEGPSVALSFANNFWGKDDAGVDPLLQRMHNAKQTCDELKSFYAARASIEEDYARKLLSLSRKPLGSQEAGTLRSSMDVLRGEVEHMGKSHQNIAGQMKTELEEPLAAFAGAMKERRKIVQNGIEKLLKVKVQQTNQVNKTRDKYEQECLKIKGYLAQGHMVMGQEERKNKAKLEKTQINLATSNTEYENAVKILEETTGRWNRDWKAAADKFQDLEEERLDFTKSSLWSFANIASTVCVSDDASCEKVRLSLENCEVEKDIVAFIKDRGTGQEIPDPPKYINFCRGDVSDSQSEASEDDSYSVAQFQRTINPAYRSSSPQPSTYESHHDPESALVRDLGHDAATPASREATITPQKAAIDRSRQPRVEDQPEGDTASQSGYQAPPRQSQEQKRSQGSRQLQLEDQPEPRTQPQIAYQTPPRQPQDHKRSQSSRQIQLQDQPETRTQPQIGYQAQPRSSQGHGRSPSSRQLQLEDQPSPRTPNQLAYQAQARQAQGHGRSQSSRQLQLEDQPDPQTQQQLRYQAQPRQSQSQSKPQNSSQLQLEDHQEPQSQNQLRYQAQPRQSLEQNRPKNARQLHMENQSQPARLQYEQSEHGPLAPVPHDPYPMDGMTMLCRTGPSSERSSAHSPGARPSSRDSNSEYSNPTSFSSQEPPSGKTSPVKQVGPPTEKSIPKKKSGFFQSHSPFRRKSNKEKENSTAIAPTNRNTWSARSTTNSQASSSRRPQVYGGSSKNLISDRPTASPEPVDPRASFQLNVGNNVFDVETSDKKSKISQDNNQQEEDLDPIAQALAELKGVTKASSSRMSADIYHGIPTPAPGSTPTSRPGGPQMANGALIAGMRGTPPPSYDQPIQRLGLPQPAFTSKAMQQTRQKYVDQTQNMFTQSRPDSQSGYGSAPQSRPGTRGSDMPRATSPAPPRSTSPRPNMSINSRHGYSTASPKPAESRQAYRSASPNPVDTRQAYRAPSPNPIDSRQAYRSASPNPYAGSQRARAISSTPQKQRGSDQGYYLQNSPHESIRTASPAPSRHERPGSSHISNEMSMEMQLAPVNDDGYGSQSSRSGRSSGTIVSRPMSQYGGQGGNQQLAARQRSKSVAEVRQYSREGRPILHFARAMYMYQAAIPEELSFAKGDILAVLRLQDDGWWEAEVTGKNERPGLVPSNYLQNC